MEISHPIKKLSTVGYFSSDGNSRSFKKNVRPVAHCSPIPIVNYHLARLNDIFIMKRFLGTIDGRVLPTTDLKGLLSEINRKK